MPQQQNPWVRKASGEKGQHREMLARRSVTSVMKNVVLYAQHQENRWARRQQDPVEHPSRQGSTQPSLRAAAERDGAGTMTK